MVILNILVEGQTEGKFVKEVLNPHLTGASQVCTK